MKQITRILALSALVLFGLIAALTFALPSNELSITFPETGTESPVSGEAEGLAAPVLMATAGADRITLSWQPVAGADSYLLYMRHSDIPWQQIDNGSLTGSSTSFPHTDLTLGETYSYTGRAVSNDGKKSPWAQQVDATVTSQTLAAPELMATVGADQITLSWQPVDGAATYELYVWDNVTGWQRLDDGSLNGTSLPHTGLTAGRAYYYWIRGITSASKKGPTSERVGASLDTDPLAAPELIATAAAGQIALSWLPIAAADTYEVRVWDSVTGWQRLDDHSLKETSLPHTGLTTGRNYYYWVRALSPDGIKGPWSERVGATP